MSELTWTEIHQHIKDAAAKLKRSRNDARNTLGRELADIARAIKVIDKIDRGELPRGSEEEAINEALKIGPGYTGPG